MKKIIPAFITIIFFCQLLHAQNALYIDSTGKVGIGTSNPSQKLTISGTGAALGVDNAATFMVKNANGNFETFLWPRWNDNMMYLNYGDAGFNIRNNQSVPAMFIAPNGNIGIGNITAPYKLTITGQQQVLALDNGATLTAKNSSGNYEEFLWPRYTDNMMYLNYGANGFNIRNNQGTPAMFMAPNGNVGIGNTTPAYKLTLSGNGPVLGVDDGATFIAKNSAGNYENFLWPRFANMMYINYGAAGFNIRNNAGGTAMFMTPDANIVIGSNLTPTVNEVPLYVEAKMVKTGLAGSIMVSIMANGMIMGTSLQQSSDLRLKQNLHISLPKNDLFLVNQLRVTDYQFKVRATQQGIFNKGFIAQDVEKIMPGAVMKHTDFVPDIFAMADKVSVAEGVLTVTLKNAHHLAKGDIVRLVTKDDQTKEATVSAVYGTSFSISGWAGGGGQLFVYGKKVNDSRTVDYQQIFSMGIGAIQELSGTVDGLKAENEALKKRLDDQDKILKALVNKVEAVLKTKH